MLTQSYSFECYSTQFRFIEYSISNMYTFNEEVNRFENPLQSVELGECLSIGNPFMHVHNKHTVHGIDQTDWITCTVWMFERKKIHWTFYSKISFQEIRADNTIEHSILNYFIRMQRSSNVMIEPHSKQTFASFELPSTLIAYKMMCWAIIVREKYRKILGK